MINGADFYLGSNTPGGYYSLFDELYDPYGGWRVYIVKGGPGTGISRMMKQIASKCAESDLLPERIWSPSDPQSLDALIFNSVRVCIADGTPPHALEPRFPGAVETTLNLGEFWDAERLYENRDEIIRLTTEYSAMQRRCIRFLEAALSLKNDVLRIALQYTDAEKIERYASRLAARKFGLPKGRVGTEKRRMLGAVTPSGIDFKGGTIESLCDDITVIEDDYGAASQVLTGLIRGYALGNGLDVISCICPMNTGGTPEHLLIPEIGFALVTSNSRHPLEFKGASRIRASRFTDNAVMREHKCRVSFSRRTEGELIDEAAVSLANALDIHSKLEAYYVEAMDFKRVQETGERIAAQISALPRE